MFEIMNGVSSLAETLTKTTKKNLSLTSYNITVVTTFCMQANPNFTILDRQDKCWINSFINKRASLMLLIMNFIITCADCFDNVMTRSW